MRGTAWSRFGDIIVLNEAVVQSLRISQAAIERVAAAERQESERRDRHLSRLFTSLSNSDRNSRGNYETTPD